MLEEELRTFEGFVKTYHAVFGEAISISLDHAVIHSQLPAEIRTHLELQTVARTAELISLMSKPVQDEDSDHQHERRQHMARHLWNLVWSRTKVKSRARARRMGKEKPRGKDKAKEKPKSEKSEGSNCWHGKENRCTRYKVRLARPVQAVRNLH